MTPEQRERMVGLLSTLVKEHPRPEAPTLVYLGRDYSPIDILEEVQAGTELGASFVDFLYGAAERFRTSVDKLIYDNIEANSRLR